MQKRGAKIELEGLQRGQIFVKPLKRQELFWSDPYRISLSWNWGWTSVKLTRSAANSGSCA